MTVNVNIAFPSLGPGILVQTSSTRGTIDYTSYKAALTADRKSADDVTAAAQLAVRQHVQYAAELHQ